MKHVRKALALMLATFIALVIAVPAFAADHSAGGTGTDINKIIVDNSTPGAKYSLIQVFEGNASTPAAQTDPYKPMAYTLTAAQKALLEKDTPTTDEQALIDFFNQWFKVTNDYNVEVKDEAAFKTYIDDATGNAAFADFAKEFGTEVVAEFTAAADENTVTFTNVPYGYYVVTSDQGDKIVTIDSSTPAETHVIDKNSKIDIDKKIVSPTENLSADGHVNSAALDQEIDFEVTAEGENYIGKDKVFVYFVEDAMDPEFSITKVPSVKIVEGTKETVLVAGTDYLITDGAVGDNGFTIDLPWTDDFDYSTDPKGQSTKDGDFRFSSGAKIVVTYSAKLDPAKVPDNYKPSNKNTATIKPKKGSDTPDHTPPTGTDFPKKETVTYNTGIQITKTDDSDPAKPLPGAVFTLSRTDGGDLVAAIEETTSSTPKYVPWVSDGQGGPDKYWASPAATSGYTKDDPTQPADGVDWTKGDTWKTYSADSTDPGYVADPNNPTTTELAYAKGQAANYKMTLADYTGWAAGTDPATLPVYMQDTSSSTTTSYIPKGKGQTETAITATTDANGIATFAGLAPGKYQIVETTVPAGYVKAADHIYTVTFDTTTKKFTWKQESPAGASDQTPDIDDLAEATIVDPVGTEFPETGGMGTRILYTVGGLMVAGAAIYLITKKRMASEA